MTQTLSIPQYKKLKREVQTILKSTRALEKASVEASLLKSYWQIGQRISRQRIVSRAGYHNTIIGRLAKDLAISPRTLQYAVSFYDTYRKFPKETSFIWGHIKLLITRHDKKERAYYEQQVLLRNLSVSALEKAIKSDQYHRARRQKFKLKKITRPTDEDYLYHVRQVRIVDADTLEADIDVGFHQAAHERIRLAGIDAPDKSTAIGQQAADHVLGQLALSTTIAIKTEKADTYGRYIAHIFYLTEPSKKRSTRARLKDAYRNGHYLNQELIDKGYAKAL